MFAVAGLTLGACVDAADSSDDVDQGNTDRITQNGFGPSHFVSAMTTAKLTAGAMSTQLSTTDGITTLGYTIQCALPAGQSFIYFQQGVQQTLNGEIGLAPSWTSRALTSIEASAVSSCVAARMNLQGVTVNISGRSPATVWNTTSGEISSYPLQEGAFWGNLFTDVGTVQFYGCTGSDKIATPNTDDLAKRHCTEDAGGGATACNGGNVVFNYAGHCADICATTIGQTWFSNCTPVGGALAVQPVTIYVQ